MEDAGELKKGEEGHITSGRNCKNEWKIEECQNQLEKLQWKDKNKEEDHVKD